MRRKWIDLGVLFKDRDIYTEVSEVTGIKRQDVKRAIIAFLYLAPGKKEERSVVDEMNLFNERR